MELAKLRTCSKLGFTYEQFDALSTEEQLDWLAFDELRQSQLYSFINSMNDAIKDKKPIEMSAYTAAVIATLE